MARVEQMFSVASARALDGRYVRVYFSMPLDNTPGNTAPANFTFTGTKALAAISANIVSDYADIRVSRMVENIAYNVTVANVRDVFGRKIHAPVTATFTGIGISPSVTGVIGIDSKKVRVTFSEVMTNDNNLGKAQNYTITGGVSVLTARVISSKVVELTTTSLTTKQEYFLTAANVRDYLGNAVTSRTGKINFVAADRPRLVSYEIREEPLALRLLFDRTLQITPAFLHPSNFAINGPVTLHKGTITAVNNSGVDIPYDDAQTGAQYQVVVGTAVDELGRLIDPYSRSLNVVLQGIAPNLVSVLQSSLNKVRIGFDYPIAATAELLNPANYTFSGASMATLSVAQHNPKIIDLTTTTIPYDSIIHLTVSGLRSTFGNTLGTNTLGFASYDAPPRVQSTTALTSPYRIRIKFTKDMLNNAVLSNPSNYVVTGPTTITISNLIVVGLRSVDLYYVEARNGGTYTTNVYNVTDNQGTPIDTAHNSASCVLTGTIPTITSVSTVSINKLRVVFNEAVLNNAALTTPSNYTFSGGVTASLVVRINATTIDITTSTLSYSTLYTLTVTNVSDAQGNYVPSPVSFTTRKGPWVSSATATTTLTVDVFFDTPMENNAALLTPTNYTFNGSKTAHLVVRISSTQVRVTLHTTMSSGFLYTVTVANVQDIDGFVVDSAHAAADFLGTGPAAIPYMDTITADGLGTIAVGFSLDLSDTNLTDYKNYTFTCPDAITTRFFNTLQLNKDGNQIITAQGMGSYPMFISNDLGQHWGAFYPDTGAMTYGPKVAQSKNGSVIFHCAFQRRLYLSTDYGLTFTEVQPKGAGAFAWRRPVCDDDGSVLIAPGFNLLYISTDSGSSWNPITTIPGTPYDFDVQCSADGSVIVVNTTASGPVYKIYVSTDTGATWADRTPVGSTANASMETGLAISNDGSCIVHVGNNYMEMRYSSNYGVSWTPITLPTTGSVHTEPAISGDGTIIYLVNGYSNKVYKSIDSAVSWTDVTGTIGERPWIVACDSTGNIVVVVSTNYTISPIEPGHVYVSTNGGTTWSLEAPPYLVALTVTKTGAKTIDISTYPTALTAGVDNYTLTVQNITDSVGTPIDPDFKTFNGV